MGAAALLALLLPLSGLPITFPTRPAGWGLATLQGIMTLSVANLLFFDGLKRIEAGPAAITATVEPLVATLIATLFLQQTLAATGWLGLTLLVAGVAGAYGLREASGRAGVTRPPE